MSNYCSAYATLSFSNLEFNLVGDNYVSQDITVTTNVAVDYEVSGIATLEKNNNTFKVIVPKNQVTEVSNITVKVKTSSPSIIVYSPNLEDNSDEFQDLAMLTTVSKDLTSISGTIIPKGKITINKIDNNNVPLSGAKIVIKGKILLF